MANILYPVGVVTGAASDFLYGKLCPYHDQPRRQCRLAGLPCVHLPEDNSSPSLAWLCSFLLVEEPPLLMSQMASPKRGRGPADADGPGTPRPADDIPSPSNAPPTHAAFSPVTITHPSKSSKRRSTILVHQKSPLLLATPPQITRALAYSHPFLLPLNKMAGLLTWTTGDPWESFLMLLIFWAVVLYGDVVIRMAGPIVVVVSLILGMYGRRFSPLSTSGWGEPAQKKESKKATANNAGTRAQRNTGKAATNGVAAAGHQRGNSEVTTTRHQKTLDEIVETLKEFTGRCNLLLEPLIEMTDFLSTQRTPTSATTRPALTTMFIRILFCTPFWVALTLPPLRIITTRRVVLVFGTLILTWHAKFMRVVRELLWRSSMVRRFAALLTGLTFESPIKPAVSNVPSIVTSIDGESNGNPPTPKKEESELTKALRRQSHHHNHKAGEGVGRDAGVKFTFIIYENQRRWVGLGWTTSLFAYERSAWTDEHNNPVPPRDAFELPEAEEGSRMAWRWVEGSRWKVDGVQDEGKEVDYDGPEGKNGWVYYDNKWQNGRRGQDGWARWTRRRKWYRDAELVEVDEDQPEVLISTDGAGDLPEEEPVETPQPTSQAYSTTEEKMVSPTVEARPAALEPVLESEADDAIHIPKPEEKEDSASLHSTSSRSFFRPTSLRRKATDRSTASSVHGAERPQRGRRDSEAKSEEEVSGLGIAVGMEIHDRGREGWGVGDEARMSLE